MASLQDWLSRAAGLSIWYDALKLPPGTPINEGLKTGVKRSRGMLVVATEEAVERGWVRRELAQAADEWSVSRGLFKVIVIAVGDVDLTDIEPGFSKIVINKPELSTDLAFDILSGLFPAREPMDSSVLRDIYLSSSWRQQDRDQTVSVIKRATDEGLRLIGDSEDRPNYTGDRIREIMQTCGGLLCVVPNRDIADASAEDGNPYRYFMREHDLAKELGLPRVVIAPPGVSRVDGTDADWIRLPDDGSLGANAAGAVSSLYDLWRKPDLRDQVFLATDLEHSERGYVSRAKALIESITGMICLTGRDIKTSSIQDGIIDAITSAQFLIADLSDAGQESFNLNVAIEVGIARATGRNVHMMAAGLPRRPPFMLQNAGQLETYQTSAERVGLLCNFASQYRRRILADELPRA